MFWSGSEQAERALRDQGVGEMDASSGKVWGPDLQTLPAGPDPCKMMTWV